MKLLELAQFLQKAAEANLKRHVEDDPDDAFEIGYHEGQLSVLEPLIPRIPPNVEALEVSDD